MHMRDFTVEQRAVARNMAAGLAVTILVLGGVWFTDHAGPAQPFADRLQSAIRGDLLVIAWLAAAIGNVARLRFFSARDIAAGSGSEAGSPAVGEANAILQNTLEQAVLAIAAHLIVAATFPRPAALVEALVGLFAVGRLFFWIGYRQGARGRAFGFALTFYPSVLALLGSATALLLG